MVLAYYKKKPANLAGSRNALQKEKPPGALLRQAVEYGGIGPSHRTLRFSQALQFWTGVLLKRIIRHPRVTLALERTLRGSGEIYLMS
jgi:hypothetical protein